MRKSMQYIPFLIVLLVFYSGCQMPIRKSSDPFYESFYEKTRLIMTQDEMKAYKSLHGEETKKEFIETFWKIRDPDPGTAPPDAKYFPTEPAMYFCDQSQQVRLVFHCPGSH